MLYAPKPPQTMECRDEHVMEKEQDKTIKLLRDYNKKLTKGQANCTMWVSGTSQTIRGDELDGKLAWIR